MFDSLAVPKHNVLYVTPLLSKRGPNAWLSDAETIPSIKTGPLNYGVRVMQDGLYKVQFQTPLGSGAGVVVLQGGKLLGGDSAIAYRGAYSETGDQFVAEVQANRHTQGLPSVFGRDKVKIHLSGTIQGDSARMQGTSPDAPGIQFQALLSLIPA